MARPLPRGVGSARRWARFALAAAMVAVGITHFTTPRPFVQHLPEWVPSRELIVYASGVLEIALGIALVAVPAAQRRNVGRVLAAFFVAVFPANLYAAVADVEVDGLPGGVYHWIRLPFQLVLIAWALWCTNKLSDENAPVP